MERPVKKYLLLLIVSSASLFADAKTVLVYGGKTGWFGQEVVKILQAEGHHPVCGESRLENRESIIKEIETVKPDYIINTAGVTGRPNINWCEDHKQDTIRTNIIGALNLIDVAYVKGLHITHFGTGCLFDYDDEHPKNTDKGFTEEDEPNHYTSFYCESKIYLGKLLVRYPNLLHLRIRMPVSYDWHPRNFIVKIMSYERIINEPNSLSVLEDLLPIAVDMTLKERKGEYNFVNPGVISHNEILELYKEIIDPMFTWKNFTVAEQDAMLKIGRSNCELSVAKLLKEYPNIPNIKTSIVRALHSMKALKNTTAKE
jgi:3,5-epimerase/4-reductase